MVGLLKFNIIKKILISVYLEIPCITFKTENSFIAQPWIQRPVLGLECIHWAWSAASRYSMVRSGTITSREWGLWFDQFYPSIFI